MHTGGGWRQLALRSRWPVEGVEASREAMQGTWHALAASSTAPAAPDMAGTKGQQACGTAAAEAAGARQQPHHSASSTAAAGPAAAGARHGASSCAGGADSQLPHSVQRSGGVAAAAADTCCAVAPAASGGDGHDKADSAAAAVAAAEGVIDADRSSSEPRAPAPASKHAACADTGSIRISDVDASGDGSGGVAPTIAAPGRPDSAGRSASASSDTSSNGSSSSHCSTGPPATHTPAAAPQQLDNDDIDFEQLVSDCWRAQQQLLRQRGLPVVPHRAQQMAEYPWMIRRLPHIQQCMGRPPAHDRQQRHSALVQLWLQAVRHSLKCQDARQMYDMPVNLMEPPQPATGLPGSAAYPAHVSSGSSYVPFNSSQCSTGPPATHPPAAAPHWQQLDDDIEQLVRDCWRAQQQLPGGGPPQAALMRLSRAQQAPHREATHDPLRMQRSLGRPQAQDRQQWRYELVQLSLGTPPASVKFVFMRCCNGGTLAQLLAGAQQGTRQSQAAARSAPPVWPTIQLPPTAAAPLHMVLCDEKRRLALAITDSDNAQQWLLGHVAAPMAATAAQAAAEAATTAHKVAESHGSVQAGSSSGAARGRANSCATAALCGGTSGGGGSVSSSKLRVGHKIGQQAHSTATAARQQPQHSASNTAAAATTSGVGLDDAAREALIAELLEWDAANRESGSAAKGSGKKKGQQKQKGKRQGTGGASCQGRSDSSSTTGTEASAAVPAAAPSDDRAAPSAADGNGGDDRDEGQLLEASLMAFAAHRLQQYAQGSRRLRDSEAAALCAPVAGAGQPTAVRAPARHGRAQQQSQQKRGQRAAAGSTTEASRSRRRASSDTSSRQGADASAAAAAAGGGRGRGHGWRTDQQHQHAAGQGRSRGQHSGKQADRAAPRQQHHGRQRAQDDQHCAAPARGAGQQHDAAAHQRVTNMLQAAALAMAREL